MPDDPRSPPPPRARALAELPVEELLARAEELAKRWAIALILLRPIEQIGDIPLEEIAREAPALCAQAIRALRSETELDRLTGKGAPGREGSALAARLGAIAGATDAAATVRAVEALRGVLWETFLEELPATPHERPRAREVAELSDRLAYVCAVALAAAVEVSLAPGLPSAGPEEEPQRAARVPPPGAGEAPDRAAAVVIVDERTEIPDLSARVNPSGRGEEGLSAVSHRPLSPEIEIRDERGEGPTAWIGSIGRQLERFAGDGISFAVLLVEPLEVESAGGDQLSGEAARVSEGVERVLLAELRAARPEEPPGEAPRQPSAAWSGSLTRERPGRYWLLVPRTDRPGARWLAERVTQAVAASVSYRGAPVTVLVGEAVCPEDGREAPALAAHADVGLYAARSAHRAARARGTIHGRA